MGHEILTFLIDAAVGFFVFLLLARFHFQWLRVPFRNQVGELVIALTNWLVRPARRVIPPLAGFDLATWMAAWLLQGAALWAQLALRGWDFGPAPGQAGAALLGVALVDLARFSVYLLVFAVIVQAVMSWLGGYNPFAAVFDAFTRPFLRPVRRLVPPVSGFDLSPLVLIVALQVALIPVAHLRGWVAAYL